MANFEAKVFKTLDTGLSWTMEGNAETSADAEKEANAYSKITVGAIVRSYKNTDFTTAPTTAAGAGDGVATFHFRTSTGLDKYKVVPNVSTAYRIPLSKGKIDTDNADISALEEATFFPGITGNLTLVDAYFTKG